MKGRVLFFNVSKGFGFITGEDGKSYFVHQTDIQMEGFRALQPKVEVEFEVVNGPDGRLQAKEVDPICFAWLTTSDTSSANLEKRGVFPLTTSTLLISPTVSGSGFSAYSVNGKVNGFRLEFPPYGGERVWLVLDPVRKEPVIVDSGSYDFCPVGSYLMHLNYKGEVVIYTLGRRHQKDGRKDLNWAIMEERFQHCYDISCPIMEQETPTTPWLERDNDGFVPSIEVCRRFLISKMEEARQE